MSSAVVTAPPPPSGMGVSKGPSSHSTVENFTVTCYCCGMPSSKEWAQRVHSRSQTPTKAFFPFLQDIKSPPAGSYMCLQDGTTYLCAFCHASLDAQWRTYEKDIVPVKERHYTLNNFICAVCGIETYRKRVRALPFQEFPFLTKERPRGSLTLGKNPLAVVCLDCSETLWAQSAEYDRWGLPVHKRHFNWMTRPPPPENSMEATVARLPSGETQLPRCPPTEPMVVPRRKEPFNVATVPKPVTEFRTRTSSASHSQNPYQSGHRSSTDGSSTLGRSPSTGHLEPHGHHLHGNGVPVVTVAPLVPHVTSTTNHNDIHNLSSKVSSLSNLELLRQAQQKPELNHATASLLANNLTYGTYSPWGGTGSHLDHFHYAHKLSGIDPKSTTHGSSSALRINSSSNGNNSGLSWEVPPAIINPDYARYQSYLAVTGNNYKNAVESYFSQPRPHPLLATEGGNSSNSTYRNTSSSIQSHHVAQLLGGKKSQTQLPLANKTSSIESSRKRHAANNDNLGSSSSLPKMPHLVHTSGNRAGSHLTPRATRHLNPGKTFDPNREYICSVSAIVNDSEMAKGRVMEDTNGAMDLSLMRALKGSATDILVQAIPSRYSVGASASTPQQDKNTSGFLIANLCSENMSPPQARIRPCINATKPPAITPLAQYSNGKDKEKEVEEDRDSVIVLSVSPSAVSKSPSVTANSPTVTEKSTNSLLKSPAIVTSTTEDGCREGRDAESAVAVVVIEKEVPQRRHNEGYPVLASQEPILEKVTQEKRCLDDDKTKSTANGDVLRDNEKSVELNDDTAEFLDKNGNKEKDGKCLEMDDLSDEKIVEKCITKFKIEKAEKTARESVDMEAKAQFLKGLELIPPKKRNDLELKILLSRFKRGTLPLIKLRPAEPKEEIAMMSEKVEKQVLLTAFEDSSLKKVANNPMLLNFMSSLDMKPASKSEKYRTEENWRLQLAERILRLKRGRHLSGGKKPWDMMDNISKHLLNVPPRKRRHSLPPISNRKPRQMRSLSLTLPPSPPFRTKMESSDLLATVKCDVESIQDSDQKETENDVSASRLGTNKQNLQKILSLTHRGKQPVITYPKYVPSYATTVPVSPVVQNGQIHSLKEDAAKESTKEPAISNGSTAHSSVSLDQKENGPKEDESDDDDFGMDIDVDAVIKRNTDIWNETKLTIDTLIKAKCDFVAGTHRNGSNILKLRKSIAAQASEMKMMAQWLKLQGKAWGH